MNERAQYAMQFFVNKGWKPHQAAGIVGNLMAESSLRTRAINPGDASDGTASVGIAQWNRERKSDLFQHAKSIGKDVNDLDAQLDFVDWELRNTEKPAGDRIRAAADVASAADGMITYERPAGSNRGARYAMHYEKRQQSSYDALKLFDPNAQVSLPQSAIAAGSGSPQDIMAAATNGNGDYRVVEVPRAAPLDTAEATGAGPSFVQTAGAVAGNSDTAWMLRSMGDNLNRYQADPNFSLSKSRLDEDASRLGFDTGKYGTLFDGAVSEDAYQALLVRAQQAQQREDVIGRSGLTGAGLQMAVEIAEDLPMDVVIGATAPQFLAARKASRLTSALVGGVAAGAVNAGGEALGATFNPDKDREDVLMAGIYGTLLGGAAGALFHNPHTVSEAFALRDHGVKTMQNTGEVAPAMRPGSSAGAAQANPTVNFMDRDDVWKNVEPEDFGTSAGPERLRQFDLGGQMGTSPNAVTRATRGLVVEAVGNKEHIVNQISAAEDKGRLAYEFNGFVQKVAKPSFDKYAKDKGAGWFDKTALKAQFSEEIAHYIRDDAVDAATKYHAEVAKVGNRMREALDQLGQLAHNPLAREGGVGRSVGGFEDHVRNPYYLMRQYDHSKIADFVERYGENTLVDLLKNGIRKKNPEIAEDTLHKLSAGFSKAILKRSYGADDLATRGFSVADTDDIRRILTESEALSASEIDNVIENLDAARKVRPTDGGDPARGKHRLGIDENAKISGLIENGVRTDKEVKFSDLLVNDAMYLYEKYVHQMSGRIALSRYRVVDPDGNMLVDGFTKDSEFASHLEKMKQWAAEAANRGDKKAYDNLDKDLKNAQFAYDYLVGRPQINMSEGWQQFFSIMSKFNFVRVMNQVGFAQVAELGRVMGHLGPKAVFSQLPELRRTLNADGELIRASGLAEDLERIGIGAFDRLLHNPGYRYDDLSGSFASLNRGRFADKAEGFLNRASHVTAEISGLNQADDMLRNMTAKAIVQKWMDFAHTGKGFTKARLADLGLSEEMTGRILKQFTKEGNFDTKAGHMTGKKVMRAYFEKWDDLPAREAFLNATYRQSRYIVQANDLGVLHRYFSSPLARIILQFRSFMLGSWTKGTLKAVHMRDRQAVASVLLGSMLAGLSYVAQTKLKAVGRSDREEYEERLLSWKAIGKASFARTGESSIIPMLVDTFNPMLGFDPQFSSTRTSGQTSNLLFGNPTTGFFDDLRTAASGTSQAMWQGEPMSQQTARTWASLLPFQNFLPVTMGLNSLISDLPEYTKKTRNND